jgi:hypothetical protein
MSYAIFTQIMKFLYCGDFDLGPQINNCLDLHQRELERHHEKSVFSESQTSTFKDHDKINYRYLNQAIDYLIDFLRVADEYLLEEVKNFCQAQLI